MIFKTIALSLAVIIGLAAIVPLATVHADGGATRTHSKAKKKKYKKYSKAWWHAYRQRAKRKKSLAALKRRMRLRQIRLANAAGNMNQTTVAGSNQTQFPADNATILPTSEIAPKGWRRDGNSMSEIQYRVADDNGASLGSAAISVVGSATGDDNENARVKTVGGVAVTNFRRSVIDRMVREQGWVVNDYQKQVGDRKVYVVAAKSPGAGGVVQSRMFYFVESDGRIYSVLMSAPDDKSKRIEEDAEKLINSLQRNANSVQQAELKK